MNLFGGGGLQNMAIFALGIMPYITASIIMQLLTMVSKRLEAMMKEGPAGQKKMNQYTRYFTAALAFIESIGFVFLWNKQGAFGEGGVTLLLGLLVVITLTVGAVMVMWLGELITQRGIGNGISLMIFASIVSRLPVGLWKLFTERPVWNWVLMAIIALAVIVFIIFVTQGQRRIPVQYAKRVVGRKVYGGQSTYLPLRVNMAGVIPVIFASSVLLLPVTLAELVPWGWTKKLAQIFGPNSWWYIAAEVILIVLFTYFYTAVQFQPIDQADNLKKYGGFVPGIRPGRPTAAYLDRVLTRITLPGAFVEQTGRGYTRQAQASHRELGSGRKHVAGTGAECGGALRLGYVPGQARSLDPHHRPTDGCHAGNPKLIETGLDLVMFSDLVFYEVTTSLYTLWQAMRRVWRLGSTRRSTSPS